MTTSWSLSLILLFVQCQTYAVTAFSVQRWTFKIINENVYSSSIKQVRPLYAGGFQWEDPVESDQGVENPFKNPNLLKDQDGNLKIDPARLLSPRLNGVNLYFIGMMGRYVASHKTQL